MTTTPATFNVLSLPYEQAETHYHDGLISDRDWIRYERAWAWSAHRIGSEAGRQQHQFYCTRGAAAYVNRINRVRRVLGLAEYRP